MTNYRSVAVWREATRRDFDSRNLHGLKPCLSTDPH